jgi:hypothetical protein
MKKKTFAIVKIAQALHMLAYIKHISKIKVTRTWYDDDG